MPIDIKPLRKILELEHEKGYTDSAVIGGLDKFLRRWAGQAVESLTSPQLVKRFRQLHLIDSDYASSTKQQRKKWVSEVLHFLPEVEHGEGEKPEVKAAPVASKPSSGARKSPRIAVKQSLDSSITVVRGISSAMAARFKRLGVNTVRDLLYFFPHRHLDYSQRKTISQLAEGDEQTIIANVWQAQEIRLGGRRSTEAIVGDETGNVRIVWFNNPYLAKQLTTNAQVVISGRVSLFNGRHVFESPEWELVGDEDLIHTGRLVPLYSLTRGLHPRQIRKLMKGFIDQWAWQMEDFLSPQLRERCNLCRCPRR